MSALTLTSRVVTHILHGAEAGSYLVPGRLPSERDLAQQLVVSRNTVTAAYAELEQRGLIRRIQGKGAFLCARPAPDQSFSWSGKISRQSNSLDEPVLELLARNGTNALPFPLSAGTPSLEAFPTAAYADSISRVLKHALPSALAVAPTEGQQKLRGALAAWLGLQPQHVMITSGAQEGIDLMARCLIEPGDHVILDAHSYPGALQSFLSAGARLTPWGSGWSLAQLEELILRYRPKLIFCMPTLQNPTGRVMTLKTREGLLELARQYRTPILEDDVYRQLYIGESTALKSLYEMDRHSLVVNVSTFSKMLAPGLRIGWLTAPLYMIKQIALVKMRSNLFTGGLNQLALADMLESGVFDTHLENLRNLHRELQDTAVRELEPSVQAGLLRFRVPAGGLYLWCKILTDIDTEAFFAALEAEGVSVAPGCAFRTERCGQPCMHFRICFTAVTREQLPNALQRMNRVLKATSHSRNGS